MRQSIRQKIHCCDRRHQSRGTLLSGALAAITLLWTVPALGSSAPTTVQDLPSASNQAAQLTGTVDQPYVETLLPVPLPPSSTERTDPSRSGGPADPVSPEPLMQLDSRVQVWIDPVVPVVDRTGQPVPEQTNIIRVTLP